MWTAFVFFSKPAYVYLIEGNDLVECKHLLSVHFSKEGKVEQGVSDLFENDYLTNLLSIFNVDDSVFGKLDNDPRFIKKAKDDLPKTLRAVDGEFCKLCYQFYPMAIPNHWGGTLICWSCRDSNRWMFT